MSLLILFQFQTTRAIIQAMRSQIEEESKNTKSLTKSYQKLEKLSWTPLLQEIMELGQGPSSRYLHSAVVKTGKVYVLGGANSMGSIKESKLHIQDLATMKWTVTDAKNYCEQRSGHSCTVLRNEIYFFGGCQGTAATSSFFKFNPSEAEWTFLQAIENVPAPRQLCLMAPIRESFIFVYGGIDIDLDQIFQDAFVYIGSEWHSLHINNNLSSRIKIKQATCGSRLLLFGGQGPSETNSLLFNDLHEVIVNQFAMQVTFQQVPTMGRRPPKRTSHGMTGLTNNLLLIYGGQTCDNLNVHSVLSDIWIFDLEQLLWIEMECCEGKMNARYDFTLVRNQRELYIFGGFDENNSIVDALTKIQYILPDKQSLEICSSCLKQSSIRAFEKNMTFSVGFLHTLALEILFPFRAIELIIDSAALLESSAINITSIKNKDDFDLMSIQFNSTTQLSDDYFYNFTEANEDQLQGQIVHQLKIGALRLGKTMLYISADGVTRKVFMTSVDSKFAPGFEDYFIHYSYIEQIDSGKMLTADGNASKQAIYNVLLTQVSDPYNLLSRRWHHLLLILQVNILPTVEKAYYYELISYSRPENDMKIYFNQKKIEMLDSLGLPLYQNPEFSLKNYLRISRIQRGINVFIGASEQPVSILSYIDLLQNYEGLGLIDAIWCKLQSKFVERCDIFKCVEGKFLEYNQGILIYCGDRLLDRFRCPFGELVSNKLCKKKYKKSDAVRNLFEFVGVVRLSEKVGVNMIGTRVKKRLEYSLIIQELTARLEEFNLNEDKLDKDMSNLYQWRFSIGKEGSKRQKRETMQ